MLCLEARVDIAVIGDEASDAPQAGWASGMDQSISRRQPHYQHSDPSHREQPTLDPLHQRAVPQMGQIVPDLEPETAEILVATELLEDSSIPSSSAPLEYYAASK